MSTTFTATVQNTGVLFPTATAGACAIAWSHDNRQSGDHVEAGNVHTQISVGSYVGADLGVTALKYRHQDGELAVGLGLDTGAGIKDKSIVLNFLGCGVTVGDEFGVQFFGSSAKRTGCFNNMASLFERTICYLRNIDQPKIAI